VISIDVISGAVSDANLLYDLAGETVHMFGEQI